MFKFRHLSHSHFLSHRSVISTNCDVSVNYNAGCGVRSSSPHSYGPSFAAAGGGWYAMERSPTTGIRIWFWSRNQRDSVPLGVKYDLGYVNPGTWGIPDSDFPTTACDYASHFDDHWLIFDTTLCVSFFLSFEDVSELRLSIG